MRLHPRFSPVTEVNLTPIFVQLEIRQRIYMDEDSFEWDFGKAAQTQVVLRELLGQMLA